MFEVKLRVNFFDADPAGILFFGNIFRLAHQAYEIFLTQILPDIDYFNNKVLLPIVHSNADYKIPIKAGEVVKVKLFVSQLRKSSFELTYLFYSGEHLKAIVQTVHVAVNKKEFKKIELPEALKNSLEKYLQI